MFHEKPDELALFGVLTPIRTPSAASG